MDERSSYPETVMVVCRNQREWQNYRRQYLPLAKPDPNAWQLRLNNRRFHFVALDTEKIRGFRITAAIFYRCRPGMDYLEWLKLCFYNAPIDIQYVD